MKKTLISIIVLAFLSSIGSTQNLAIADKFAEKSVSKVSLKEQTSYPICGTPILIPKEQAIIDYFREHPEERALMKTAKSAWNFNVGDTHNWWASSWVTNDYYLVESTCRAVGENCYVFVADDNWEASLEMGSVNQEAVDAIINGFDNTTPNFPTRGIYDVDTSTFGDPPDVDGDPKIIILILDIQDGYDGSVYVAGYFSSANEVSHANSNNAEMFYMDCKPANLLTANGRNDVLNTTAHEFQHMIHYRWDPNETTFPNEGLSEIASYVNGYGFRNDDGYRSNTNRYLFNWDNDDALPDYTRAALWTLYLLEQHPNGFLKMLVQEPKNGGDGINQALTTYGAIRTWQEIFVDWLIANYLQDITVDPRWGYAYPNSIASIPVATHATPDVTGSETIKRTSGQYLTFAPNIPDTITFTPTGDTYADQRVIVKAIKIGTNTVVEDVPVNVPYTVAPNGETYTDVTFCIINNSGFTDYGYDYVSTGVYVPPTAGNYELFYEDGTPDGYLGVNEGDSIAVWFDGITGGKLDSIKVIFQGSGQIKYDISKVGTDFLRGEPLLAQKRINIMNPSSDWVLMNLTANNIDASEDFVVSFLHGADPENPTIRISKELDTDVYHSRTYTLNGGTTQWWIFYESGTPDKYYNYMIRAYVSVGGGTVAIDQSGIVTIPNEFSLEQNYPNPFNPSTTFSFSTPKDGLVNFTVHDLLGRVVYSESRNIFAGNYSFTWDGQNQLDQQVVSGVYFLRMESEGFTQTRKMLMMK